MPATPPQPGSDNLELAPKVRVPRAQIDLSYTSASGPGGQNVNKRATKARLRIPLDAIPINPPAKARLAKLAGSLLTDSGDIVIASDEHRSQSQNRQECFDRLRNLIVKAVVRPKVRRPTKPSRGAIQRRLDAKKQRGQTKRRRKDLDE